MTDSAMREVGCSRLVYSNCRLCKSRISSNMDLLTHVFYAGAVLISTAVVCNTPNPCFGIGTGAAAILLILLLARQAEMQGIHTGLFMTAVVDERTARDSTIRELIGNTVRVQTLTAKRENPVRNRRIHLGPDKAITTHARRPQLKGLPKALRVDRHRTDFTSWGHRSRFQTGRFA